MHWGITLNEVRVCRTIGHFFADWPLQCWLAIYLCGWAGYKAGKLRSCTDYVFGNDGRKLLPRTRSLWALWHNFCCQGLVRQWHAWYEYLTGKSVLSLLVVQSVETTPMERAGCRWTVHTWLPFIFGSASCHQQTRWNCWYWSVLGVLQKRWISHWYPDTCSVYCTLSCPLSMTLLFMMQFSLSIFKRK